MGGPHHNTKLIQVYSPDSAHLNEVVDSFYESLGEEKNKNKGKGYIIQLHNRRRP